MKKELGIFVLLVALCTVTSVINPRFLSDTNLINTANIVGIYGIFSIGLGLVIITGGIDLSVGSMFALCGVLLPMALREWHWPWPLAALAAIALPMFLGWIHGTLITRLKIQPFIITLCGLLIYRGLARYFADDNTKGFGNAEGFETLQQIAKGNHVFGMPNSFTILIIVSIIMWFVLHRSIYGRYLFAVGRNEEAARFSGINTRFVISSSYVVAGLLTGIASLLMAFYTNSVGPSNHGSVYELYGIAAAVLGGCSLRGGEGSIFGILIGTALLQVLQNIVNLINIGGKPIPSTLNYTVLGTVVLIGVIADQLLSGKKKPH